MFISALLALGLCSFDRPVSGASGPRVVYAGWNDELNDAGRWSPIAMENRARVDSSAKGRLVLSLGQTPQGWPYTYQWSGLTRKMSVDMARYPVVMAKVGPVVGYAHLDIEVLDATDKAVKVFRSSTANGPGVVWTDLSKVLDPAIYSLRLRLIVGGENTGCSATYQWVRFVSAADAPFLIENPDFKDVRSMTGRRRR